MAIRIARLCVLLVLSLCVHASAFQYENFLWGATTDEVAATLKSNRKSVRYLVYGLEVSDSIKVVDVTVDDDCFLYFGFKRLYQLFIRQGFRYCFLKTAFIFRILKQSSKNSIFNFIRTYASPIFAGFILPSRVLVIAIFFAP